jgi:hypothetical protein
MPQRHPNDTVAVLHEGASDPTHRNFVPVQLRDAFARIPPEVEADLTRELWSTVRGDIVKTVGRRSIKVTPSEGGADFETALIWSKLDVAARQVARDAELREGAERARREHTCRVCGTYDVSVQLYTTPSRWCALCRAELERQDAEAHAARRIDGKTVGELVKAARADQARAEAS